MSRMDGSESRLSMQRIRADNKPKVAYYYDNEIGNYYYGLGHPMKPYRIRMAHNLLLNYGLLRKMDVYRPRKATVGEMARFHSGEYIEFLQAIRPDKTSEFSNKITAFNIVDDCPVFDGMYDFSSLTVGGSLAGAVKLNKKECDIAVNWSGGLHHAKKSSADGFCYVNDIVIAILELLKYHERVLYIDIDVHHGDGVEEAFFATDRVMTLSFHKFGQYFPGTGHIDDVGIGSGKLYSVNFPLHDGIDDDSYQRIFEPIVETIMERYRPDAVVLQCGADSLTADLLGCFNLTLKGHSRCVEYVKKFRTPILLLGGGGYTIRNVARCWALETACALDEELSNELPYNEYFEYYSPDFKLHVSASNQPNDNSERYLQDNLQKLLKRIQCLSFAPSVPFHERPLDAIKTEERDAEDADADERIPQFMQDKIIERDADLLDRAEGGEPSFFRNRGRVTINTPGSYGPYGEKNPSGLTKTGDVGDTSSRPPGKRIKIGTFSSEIKDAAVFRRPEPTVV